MFTTAIALPSCSQPQQQAAAESTGHRGSNNNTTEVPTTVVAKRASVHITEGSVTSKRISLLFNHSRCRSFSESWAFLSPSSNVTRPPAQTFDRKPSKSMSTLLLSSSSSSSDEDESSHSMESFGSDTPSSVATTPTSSSPVPAAHSSSSKDSNSRATTANTDYKDLPDQELLKSLAAFLKGHNNSEVEEEEGVSSMCRRSKDPSRVNALCKSDGHGNEPCDLVITVRDFAYPKSHPHHFGDYPREPVYEDSEINEDDEDEDEDENMTEDAESSWGSSGETVDDRTMGHARGLYDFDAENSSELSFKEGDLLWILCKQFPGWFLGEMGGVQGLVPENYVQLI